MDRERWQQIERLYHDALARPAAERGAFLAEACGSDDALAHEVASLIERGASAQGFLSEPAAAVMGAGASSGMSMAELPAAGATLGGYRIERLLGRGGMGAVFLAYDTTLHRRVALKVLIGTDDGDASRSRLLREARNAAALNHPNICTILEVGDAGAAAFIAMEYVEGRSLRERLEEGALPLDEAARYGLQAADALAYAHEHGVVHRDFKAANVIVTPEGRLKIIDFGLARRGDAVLTAATTMSSLVPEGTAAGTPYAMAPEQVCGEVTDGRTDIWALGVLLYEMASGAAPFAGATVPELFSSILRDAPAPLPDPVPPAYRAIVERCLEKASERRYQRASDIRAALEAVVAGAVPPWTIWRYRLGRRGWLAPAAALVAAAIAVVGFDVGGIRDWLVGGSETEPIRLAVLPFENLTGDPEQEYFSDGLTEEMITQLGMLQPRRLSVVARTSSMRYKNGDVPTDQIGRELRVDYLLEGSARREGNRVRISATLIDVREQTQRWSESYDREVSGMLVLQNEVARGVARSLALTLLPDEEARLASVGSVNPEAYNALLRGIYAMNQDPQAGNLERALEAFQRAVQLDPAYAEAHAWAARSYNWLGNYNRMPPSDVQPKALEHAQRALALNDRIPQAHETVGWYLMNVAHDWAGAEQRFRRALEIDPDYGRAHNALAWLLSLLGRHVEALRHAERFVELDPLLPQPLNIVANVYHFWRRYDRALEYFQKSTEMEPARLDTRFFQARTFAARGDHQRAADAFMEYLRIGSRGGAFSTENVAACEARSRAGGPDSALTCVKGVFLSEPAFVGEALFVSAMLGDVNATLDGLEQMASDFRSVTWHLEDPLFDSVRTHPRFVALLRLVKLPADSPAYASR